MRVSTSPQRSSPRCCSRRGTRSRGVSAREGADPDGVDEDGRSSLLLTSAYGALGGIAARLIAAGAKLDLVSAEGASALMFACLYRNYQVPYCIYA
jgi:hypothetical protein